MVAWSSIYLNGVSKANLIRSVFSGSKSAWKLRATNYVPVRESSSERTLNIRASQYQYTKFKDLVNFYLLLGIIPITLFCSYVNIFIGPAKLALIPEGYEPKPWEYYEHPITRFIVKHILLSPQENYERNMHSLFVSEEKRMIRLLEKRIYELMRERADYQAWYFSKPITKYARYEKEHMDETEFSHRGRAMGFLH